MRVWFKQVLVRVVACVIVGIAVIVSTQLLRGQDPEDVTSQIKQIVRSTILAWVSEPGSTDSREASPQSPDISPQSSVRIGEVAIPTPMIVTIAAAQTAPPKIEVPEYCKKANVSSDSIVMGDKLHLRFFSSMRMPAAGSGFSSPAEVDSVAFERLDLSGIYDIGEDGTTALPLVGRIELVGRNLACAEALVASDIAVHDSAIRTVTAAFSARLPVTVSGVVRAPGAYTHTPGMNVNRLLNLAGASFSDNPITPQELDALVAQRDDLRHRQILAAIELGRLKANIAGNNEIAIADSLVANVPATLLSALIDAESTALRQDLSVSRASDERSVVAIAGLAQKFEDTRSQHAAVETQLESLQARHDEMTSFKSRGLIQASQLDGLLSNLMELSRIKMQLETDQSNLGSQIELAKEDARLAIQVRLQGFTQRAAALSGEISLFDVQLSAIGLRLAGHMGNDGTDFSLPFLVSVLRTEVSGAYRLEATLDTVILPGDMVTVSLSSDIIEKQVTAENNVANASGATASGSLQP